MKAKTELFAIALAEEIREPAPSGKRWWRVKFTQTEDWVELANEIRSIEGLDAFIKNFLDYILSSTHFSYGGTFPFAEKPTTKEICEILLDEMKIMDKIDTSVMSANQIFAITKVGNDSPRVEHAAIRERVPCRITFERTWSVQRSMEAILKFDDIDSEIRDFIKFVIDNKFQCFTMYHKLSHRPTLLEVCALANASFLASKDILERDRVHVERSARTLLPKPNAIKLD